MAASTHATHRVHFIHLDDPHPRKKEQIICAQVSELFIEDRVLLIRIDQEYIASLDRALWCELPDRFLPHGILPCDLDMHRLLLTTQDCQIEGVDILIVASPQCDFMWQTQFPWVVDFAEVYDPVRREQSRERFKRWKALLGVSPEYDKQYASEA